MDFFEGLRERAGYKIEEDFATPTDYRHRIGINATIEALKEMMVGEPRKGHLRHIPIGYVEGDGITEVQDGAMSVARFYGKFIGTNGEEVTVLVFRDDKEK